VLVSVTRVRVVKAIVQNLILVLVSCLVAFAGIEASLRVWGPEALVVANPYAF
jgi:hypothetical protein